MSNTRHAKNGSAFHQEKFCSAPEQAKGLLANLVAMRCEGLEDPADRELVWMLQKLSWDIGLRKLANDLVAAFAEHVGAESTPARGAQRSRARRFLPGEEQEHRARIASDVISRISDGDPVREEQAELWQPDTNAALASLPEWLSVICLDPEYPPAECEPWFFPKLRPLLRQHLANLAATRRDEGVITETGRQMGESLDYALETGCLVVAEGPARTGKTFSAREWCEQHPGRARYVQVPASSDDISFFRKIAQALGCASALSLKGVQLRERVEYTLQSSKLMLVLDEAHYLWPQNNRREALPNRINWLMTALVNYKVPVGLVVTPQFSKDLAIVEKKTGWTSEQFIGRIGDYKKLPDTLSDADLEAVSRRQLPEGDARSIRKLVLYAKISRKCLAAIETTVQRARFLARKAGREKCIAEDVTRAIDLVTVCDSAVAKAQAGAQRHAGTAPALVSVPTQEPVLLSPSDSAGAANAGSQNIETNRVNLFE